MAEGAVDVDGLALSPLLAGPARGELDLGDRWRPGIPGRDKQILAGVDEGAPGELAGAIDDGGASRGQVGGQEGPAAEVEALCDLVEHVLLLSQEPLGHGVGAREDEKRPEEREGPEREPARGGGLPEDPRHVDGRVGHRRDGAGDEGGRQGRDREEAEARVVERQGG